MANAKESQVRVAVRVRPLSSMEIAADSRAVIKYPDRNMIQIGEGDSNTYTFDDVFPSAVSQAALFNETAAPMIQSFLKGYNVTVIAYGQTGSGKTFTMGSASAPDDESIEDTGLIPRFLDEIFAQISSISDNEKKTTEDTAEVVINPLMNAQVEDKLESGSRYVTVSFLEIYGDDIFDLLKAPEGEGKGRSLLLREDEGCVSVVGLTSVNINSAGEALNQLGNGTERRTTGSTLMNTVSSRSHAVFTVTLHQTIFGEDVVSKMSFVDLAGSERLKKTGAEGQQRKEGIQINQGLLALGNVINALGSEDSMKKRNNEKVHVGYRESKLTRLLQDALGGNSRTLFLACVSPAEFNLNETLSTLRYAYRTRNIQNKPVKNGDPVKEELRRLNGVLYKLKIELIQEKFCKELAEEDGNNIDTLLQRKEVKAFMDELDERLNIDKCGAHIHMQRDEGNASEGQPTLLTNGSAGNGSSNNSSGNSRLTLKPFSKTSTLGADENDEDDEEMSRSFEEASAEFLTEEEVLDPENDVRMINQLIEMLKKDDTFEKAQKEQNEDLVKMDDEILQKEEILEQLKKDMELYRAFFDEYESLVKDKESLEAEKQQLLTQMSQYEKNEAKSSSSSAGGGGGGGKEVNKAYVLKLKDQLKSVENRLKLQSSEQKKREHAMELMKRDNSKCKELESSISALKKSRVETVKKQKESAAQFKTFMNQKNKELIEARKLRMKEKREHSKLEVENRKLNDMMGRKVKAHQKTEQALQRNKQHLVKLLAERKREQQRQRSSKRQANKSSSSNNGNGTCDGNDSKSCNSSSSSASRLFKKQSSCSPSDDVLTWAPEDQKIRSSKFFLLEMLNMRVAKRERQEKEESLQAEYDSLQRLVFEEVENLNLLKESVLTGQEAHLSQKRIHSEMELENDDIHDMSSIVANGSDAVEAAVDGNIVDGTVEAASNEKYLMVAANNELIEQEERLEALILKMSLVGEALSEIHLPAFDDITSSENTTYDDEMREIDMVAQMEAPMLRTVLWSLLDGHSDSLYEKQRLQQQLRLKTAEACAYEEKASNIEQDNNQLKRGFHERVNMLQHERTELVQAFCSPVGKKSHPSSHIHHPLADLNVELEEKLTHEIELRNEMEWKFKEAEKRAMELDEKLKLALCHQNSVEEGNSAEEKVPSLSQVVEDIQTVWNTIELEPNERSQLLDTIVNANMTCALSTLTSAKEEEVSLTRETEDQATYLKKIEKFTNIEISSKILSEGTCKAKYDSILKAKQYIQPKLDAYAIKVAKLKENALSLTSNLFSFEKVEMENLEKLMNFDVSLLFQDCEENTLMNVPTTETTTVPLDQLCEMWEKENRKIAFKLANVQSNLHQCVEQASKQLYDLDMNDVNEISILACRVFTEQSVSLDMQNKVCNQLIHRANPVCAGASEYVLILKKVIRVIDIHYQAWLEVSNESSRLLETWFETAYDNIEYENDKKMSRKSISYSVHLIHSLLEKSRQSCEGFVVKMESSWNELNIPVNQRAVIPQAWKTRELKHGHMSLTSAASRIHSSPSLSSSSPTSPTSMIADEKLSVDWLKELSGKLRECFQEASDYNDCAKIVHPLLRKLEEKETLESDILELDLKLVAMKEDATLFEQKDPKRLADRSGKGRLNLKHEEQQRKQIQKDTRFLFSELSKKLNEWEQSEGVKFDANKLSVYGLEVLNEGKKAKSSFGSKTSLMHLEAGIQVGNNNTRRNSSENGTKRESFEKAATAGIDVNATTTATIVHKQRKSEELNENDSNNARNCMPPPSARSDVMCTPMADKSSSGGSRLSMTGGGATTGKRNPFDRVTNSNKLRASILKTGGGSMNMNHLAPSSSTSNPLSPENISAALAGTSTSDLSL